MGLGKGSMPRAPQVSNKPILTGLAPPVMSIGKGLNSVRRAAGPTMKLPGGKPARSILRAPRVSNKPILTGLGQPVMSNGKDAGDSRAYGFSVRDLGSDNEVDLSRYKGSVSLIVNVASE